LFSCELGFGKGTTKFASTLRQDGRGLTQLLRRPICLLRAIDQTNAHALT